MKPHFAAASIAVLLAACQTMPDEPLMATAGLSPTKGNKTHGEATFEEAGASVRVVIFVEGLKPGQDHGLHIHEKGDCSSGDGMSAGGHFDPYGKPHGIPGSKDSHAGDLPALKANKAGRANINIELDTISLKPGPANIIGRAVVVHAGPDDYKTQPTGNSGARIACGVIGAH
jgi:Cu-Zn family superoxide dismutase